MMFHCCQERTATVRYEHVKQVCRNLNATKKVPFGFFFGFIEYLLGCIRRLGLFINGGLWRSLGGEQRFQILSVFGKLPILHPLMPYVSVRGKC